MELPSLYELSTEVALALESDDDGALEALDALLPKLEHKAANVARWIELQADTVELLRSREARIREERQARERRVERVKEYLLDCMTRAEVMRITDTRTGTEIRMAKNPPRVVVDDEDAIPAVFWKQPEPPPPCIDKKELAKALKENTVPGARLEQGWRVEIKG